MQQTKGEPMRIIGTLLLGGAMLGGCASQNVQQLSLPDRSRLIVSSSCDERVTIAACSVVTYQCKGRHCTLVPSNGGTSAGAAPILAGGLGIAANSVLPGSSFAVNALSGSISNAKAVGGGDTRIGIGVNNTNVSGSVSGANAQAH